MDSYNSNARYGWDNFSKFLAVVSLPFLFARSTIALIVGIVLLAWSIYRALSRKNIGRRRREEITFENWSRQANYCLDKIVEAFQNFNGRIRNWYLRQKWKLEDRKRFKVIKCPECAQRLRVPRNKGKLLVTCRECRHKFYKKT